jgi:hypothetical protein
MFKKIIVFLLIGSMALAIFSCNIFKEGTYSRSVEVEEREPHNIVGGVTEIICEDTIFKYSEFIFKGAVIDAVEIAIEEYIGGELHYIFYMDVFTFEVEEIYFSEDSSVEVGDVINVANGSCSNDWIPGTVEMEKDKRYIVLTQKSIDTGTTDFTEYFDYATVDHWPSIILVQNGKYYVDEILESLTGNAEEEFIREDGDFETTVYVKGEEFEQELEALILEKKEGS